MDAEFSSERIKCLKRLFPNEEDRAKTINDFSSFSLKCGAFGDPSSMESRYNMDPRMWWAYYGSHAPLIQKVAFQVLGQPTSSSCSERNWSLFLHSFV